MFLRLSRLSPNVMNLSEAELFRFIFCLSAHVGHEFLPYVCFPPYTLGCISKLSFQVISMFAGIRSRRGWSSVVLRAIIFGWCTSELGVGIGVGVVVIGLGVVRELEWSRS